MEVYAQEMPNHDDFEPMDDLEKQTNEIKVERINQF